MANCVGGYGEFAEAKGWTRDRRDALIQRLVQVILNRQYSSLLGIGAGLLLEDWEKEGYRPNPDAPKFQSSKLEDLRRAGYIVSFEQLMHIVATEFLGSNDYIVTVYDVQDKMKHYVDLMYERVKEILPDDIGRRVSPPIPADSKQTIHLQAADLIAYETFQNLYRWRFSPELGERSILRTLRAGRKHRGTYWSTPRSQTTDLGQAV